jgi:hypothetical protein
MINRHINFNLPQGHGRFSPRVFPADLDPHVVGYVPCHRVVLYSNVIRTPGKTCPRINGASVAFSHRSAAGRLDAVGRRARSRWRGWGPPQQPAGGVPGLSLLRHITLMSSVNFIKQFPEPATQILEVYNAGASHGVLIITIGSSSRLSRVSRRQLRRD